MDLPHVRTSFSRVTGTPTGTRDEAILAPALARELAVAVSLIVLIGVARSTPPLTGPRAVVAWLSAVAFGGAFVLATLRPNAVTAVVCGLCGVAMQAVSLGATGLLMVVVAIIQSSRFASPLGPGIAIMAGVGYEAASTAAARSFELGVLLSSSSGLVFAYLAASGYRRLRDEKRKTETLLHEVLAGRDALIRAATLDERARIAREIHDILAHTLSALAVQLEGTRLLVEQRPGDPATLNALERASHLAREGLQETRQAVGALRGDALPGPEELPRLAADFERDSGIPCHLSVEGAPAQLSPEARLSLYRTAQEALTNVRKHAEASSVTIRLCYGPRDAVLTVEDEGTSRPSALIGSGHGLDGMRERAELAHGRLEAGPMPGGFKVCLWLPA